MQAYTDCWSGVFTSFRRSVPLRVAPSKAQLHGDTVHQPPGSPGMRLGPSSTFWFSKLLGPGTTLSATSRSLEWLLVEPCRHKLKPKPSSR